MATKNKKTSKKSKTLIFNKKNTLALADAIYTDKGGIVSFLKLCGGDLKNGKDGGRTTHCAVGEAYFTFVSHDMSKIFKVKNHEYESKYDGVESEAATAKVIDALVNRAQLKKPTEANKEKLAWALDNAVSENDGLDHNDKSLSTYAERSQRVAEVFRKEVAPLLK
jgi:hypothetical protein